jgi:hypothetical protein
VCAVLLEARAELVAALHEDRASALEEACAANPRALWLVLGLPAVLGPTSPRRAYAAVMAALLRGKRAGHEVAPSILARDAAVLVRCGALGPMYRLSQVRPLAARARRLLDAAKRGGAVPAVVLESVDETIAELEASIAEDANEGEGDDAEHLARRFMSNTRVVGRTCARCGLKGAEMPACSRCRAARYCSPACQKAHWPEHKAACKAAAASGGGG